MKDIILLQKIRYLIFVCFLYSFGISNTAAKNGFVIPYKVNDLYGFSDTLGNILIKPKYTDILDLKYTFDKKTTSVHSQFILKKNDRYFVIDENENPVIPENNTYDSILFSNLTDNAFITVRKGEIGLLRNGKELIKCEYDDINSYYNYSFIVQKNGMYGLINHYGKLVIPIKYDKIKYGYDDKNKNKFGWKAIDKNGIKIYTDDIYETYDDEYIPKMIDEEVMTKTDDNSNKLNTDNKQLQNLLKADEVKQLGNSKEYFFIYKDGKVGAYNLATNIITVPIIYDNLLECFNSSDMNNNPILIASLNDNKGIITLDNNVLLPIKYDNVDEFADDKYSNLFTIKSNYKLGIFINNTIYPPIEPKYDFIFPAMAIKINNNWTFQLFSAYNSDFEEIGYVGENGVEYFKR
jgi:hypothetical protein